LQAIRLSLPNYPCVPEFDPHLPMVSGSYLCPCRPLPARTCEGRPRERNVRNKNRKNT
jgi:hypothetical protein